MTFKDFMVEAALYEYSEDYFTMTKECSEICLTEMYLENQMALNESLENLVGIEDNDDITLTEGYLTEAADDNQVLALTGEVQQKKQGLLKRIWEKFKSAVRRFGQWLFKIAGGVGTPANSKAIADLEATIAKLKDDNAKKDQLIKELEEKLAKAEKDLEKSKVKVANLKTTIKSMHPDNAAGDAAAANKRAEEAEAKAKAAEERANKAEKSVNDLKGENKKLKRNLKDAESGNKARDLQIKNLTWSKDLLNNKLIAAYNALETAKAEKRDLEMTIASVEGNLSKACAPKILIECLKDFANAFSSHSNDFAGIERKLEQAVAAAHVKPVVIPFHEDGFRGLGNELDKALKDAESAKNTAGNDMQGAAMEAANKALAKLQTSMSATMSLINETMTYAKKLEQVVDQAAREAVNDFSAAV